jgi:hypothetical protein
MYAMTSPGQRRPHYPAEGLEASRKVGWARFYVEQERADGLATINHVQRERIETLLEALARLVDAVLTSKNVEAFAFAYSIRVMLDRLEEEYGN